MTELGDVLISEGQIAHAVEEIAGRVSRDYDLVEGRAGGRDGRGGVFPIGPDARVR